MLADALLAYLHFLTVFALAWCLAREWTLLRDGGDLDVARLARVDAGFGVSAGLVLLTGALRAVFGAKGWAFYAHNPAFHAKLGLFVLVGLASIVPTLAFLRWRRQSRADAAWRVPGREWRAMRGWVAAELAALALIPLLAALMARGIR
jgi:putative membrane protein